MLVRAASAVRSWAEATNPWTNVIGVGRTLLALATALTLIVNPTTVLFRPLAGQTTSPPFCIRTLEKVGPFCLGASHLEVTRWVAVLVLLVVASGWRPRVTAPFHWWICASLQGSGSAVDGGDQAAAVLALLLLPICLTDPRRWHWDAAVPVPPSEAQLYARVVALVGVLAVRLQVAGIYFHAAVGKVRVTEWVDGTAIYYWLGHPLFGMNDVFVPFIRPLLLNSVTVALITWGVIVLEFFLAAGIIATRRARSVLLVLGIALHFAILLLHGLFSFAVTMFAALIMYLRPVDEPFEHVQRLWQRWRTRAAPSSQDIALGEAREAPDARLPA